ncbi:MAG: hypothetical protein L6Q73_19485 [Aquabacterium sp.]|nr:hypothetical protein [Aquabacterium sp.]
MLSASRPGLPLFALARGLIDGLNPCAMWVLLFLLSMRVRLRDRARMAWIAGTFVAVSGAACYAFMAAWLNLFLAVGLSEAVRLLLAVLALAIGAFNIKDFIAWGRGPSIGIPQAAKPGIYARMRAVLQARAWSASLLGVAALAVVVNMVELLCTAGIPARLFRSSTPTISATSRILPKSAWIDALLGGLSPTDVTKMYRNGWSVETLTASFLRSTRSPASPVPA